MDIIHGYPNIKNKINYPYRISKVNFDEYSNFLKNTVLQEKYKKWVNGINYITNRKIMIGGDTHQKINIFWFYQSNYEI